MIREHEFNSAWMKVRAGVLEDLAFFAQPAPLQREQLAPFAWVELRAPLSNRLPHAQIARAGFFLADTQLRFRIGLQAVRALPGSPSLDALEVASAERVPFVVDALEMAPFVHERFLLVPGVTQVKLAERYARWSNELIARQPATCLRVRSQGRVQGWFLSEPHDGTLHLALAMLHRDAIVSGLHLYQRALATYAEKGARVGAASFSAGNTAVHNLYARLGAQFVAPEGRWLWTAPA